MINLIKGEIKKIFHKKSFLVVTVIFILYCILVNVLYKTIDNSSPEDYLITIEKSTLEEQNLILNREKESELKTYLENKSLLELFDLRASYHSLNSKYLLDKYIYNLLLSKNEAIYLLKDQKKVTTIEQEISNYITHIDEHDEDYFTNLELSNLEKLKSETTDVIALSRYDAKIKLNKYRLENKVPYNPSNYLHQALDFINTNLFEYQNLEAMEVLTKAEQKRQTFLKENILKNEYILKNKLDINNNATLRGSLINFASEFSIFILIYIILISGPIVSEEFNKGTIKNLLTLPFKRSKILLSKYLTVILMLPLIIIAMFLINLIIGTIIFGPSSLSIPIVLYHHTKEIITIENVFSYNFKLLLSVVPEYLTLATFSFALSTITCQTSSAVTLTFMLYLIGNIIRTLYLTYQIKILKFFISLHWDFSYLVNLTPNEFKIKPLVSLSIVVLYIIVILCLTFIYFHKKDVKNI